MIDSKTFNKFLDTLRTDTNVNLIESVREGYALLVEGDVVGMLGGDGSAGDQMEQIVARASARLLEIVKEYPNETATAMWQAYAHGRMPFRDFMDDIASAYLENDEEDVVEDISYINQWVVDSVERIVKQSGNPRAITYYELFIDGSIPFDNMLKEVTKVLDQEPVLAEGIEDEDDDDDDKITSPNLNWDDHDHGDDDDFFDEDDEDAKPTHALQRHLQRK